jgi:hypothetical protein
VSGDIAGPGLFARAGAKVNGIIIVYEQGTDQFVHVNPTMVV